MEKFSEEETKFVDSSNNTGMKQAKASNGDIVRQKLKPLVPDIVDRLIDIINSPDSSNKDKISAAATLFRYGVEVPTQSHDLSNTGEITIIRKFLDDKSNE